uniref:receptor protein-tyrosine kinase n=1 Tax=Timema genevievae TaxID=629358 RepID=A0A7R9JN42_TIMGE|nr:unnamed protein product [Timema genevievae]
MVPGTRQLLFGTLICVFLLHPASGQDQKTSPLVLGVVGFPPSFQAVDQVTYTPCQHIVTGVADWPDYVMPTVRIAMEPEFKPIPAHTEIHLQCRNKARSDHDAPSKSHHVNWLFKKCGVFYNMTRCEEVLDLPEESWEMLPCRKKQCRLKLVLTNTTESNSGLYRCVIPSKTGASSKTIKTYQLEVIDRAATVPQFVDDLPTNVTVFESNTAVLQCKVLSREPPNIWWLKRQEEFKNSSLPIQFYNNYYERVNNSSEKSLSDELYLNKLIISRTTEADSGYYVCLVASSPGYNFRGAYLTVRPTKNLEYKGSLTTDSAPLSLLFLIPAALALTPAVVGLCIWWCRHCGKNANNIVTNSQQPVVNNNNPTVKVPRTAFKYKPVAGSSGVVNCRSDEINPITL